MSRSLRTALLLSLWGLCACRSSTPRVARPDTRSVERPVQAARQEMDDARTLWREAMQTPDPLTAERALEEALRQLAIATTLNPGNPLCRSRAGDLQLLLAHGPKSAPALFLEQGVLEPKRLAEAQGAYEDSLAISEDWIPGRLGLAQVALLTNDPETALEHTEAAARSLEKARGLAQREPTFAELVFNTDLGPVENVDPMGSLRPEEQRLASYNSYLAAEVGGWQLGGGPPGGSEVTVGSSFDRLAARIVFLQACARAQAELAEEGERTSALAEFQRGVQEALRYDGDWFEAVLARARAAAEAGDAVVAVEMLEPFLDGEYELVRRQDWILASAARWRLAAFALERDYDRLLLTVGWLSERIADQRDLWQLLPMPLLELVMLRSDLFLAAARGQLADGFPVEAETSVRFAREDALSVEATLNRLARAGAESAAVEPVREAHKRQEQAITALRLEIERTLETR